VAHPTTHGDCYPPGRGQQTKLNLCILFHNRAQLRLNIGFGQAEGIEGMKPILSGAFEYSPEYRLNFVGHHHFGLARNTGQDDNHRLSMAYQKARSRAHGIREHRCPGGNKGLLGQERSNRSSKPSDIEPVNPRKPFFVWSGVAETYRQQPHGYNHQALNRGHQLIRSRQRASMTRGEPLGCRPCDHLRQSFSNRNSTVG
jgi:hypothetical protein